MEEEGEEKEEVEVEVRRRKPSSLTSLVLSMAFRMATFSFSRADRTLTYSPRCGVKYSGRGKKRRSVRHHSAHTLARAIYHTRDKNQKIYCKNLRVASVVNLR